jgi:pilus assembly protein CpaC
VSEPKFDKPAARKQTRSNTLGAFRQFKTGALIATFLAVGIFGASNHVMAQDSTGPKPTAQQNAPTSPAPVQQAPMIKAPVQQAPGQQAAPQSVTPAGATLERVGGKHAGEMVVALNKSQVLRLDQPFVELFVGNPEIADVLALTDRSVYVLGKALGTTNLLIYGKDKTLIAVVDLSVSHDIDGLKLKLHELAPSEPIEVRAANDGLVLSGMVSNADVLSRAIQLAERYAVKKVTNLMTVKGSQQVMLKVHFVELSRSVAKELNFRSTINGLLEGRTFGITPLAAPAGSLFGLLTNDLVQRGDLSLIADIRALEEKGLAKVLAEPNLIALSGETAEFLAGGEIPIPVPQSAAGGGTTVTIVFKPFGVGLAFTPTVLADGLISLVAAPEVSSIDDSIAVEFAGGAIPGFKTSRAKTTVELRDGQSFAIAGLLQENFSNNISQFPWLGDLPILGLLFRSPDFQRRETELVVIVSVNLVKPVKDGLLASPQFTPPGEANFMLGGQMEEGGGALSGPIGHILP